MEASHDIIDIPRAARGLHVLLVDHDTTCLTNMASVLQENSYKVTTTKLAPIALSLVRQRGSSFDLVIVDADIPGFPGFTLLHQILLIEKDIAVILMSSNGDTDMAKEALGEGACSFFFKPVHNADLIKVWQHFFRNRANKNGFSNEIQNKQDQIVDQTGNSCVVNEQVNNIAQEPLIHDPNKGKAPCLDEGKGCENAKDVANTDKLIIGGNEKIRGKEFEELDVKKRKKMEKRKKKRDCGVEKKPRMVWKPELHEMFVNAIAILGEDHAQPKAILDEMNIPGLSHRQIASHLQKHRQQMSKIRELMLKDPPILESNMTSGYPTRQPPYMSMTGNPPIFESIMTKYPTHQPLSMPMINTQSIFYSFLPPTPTDHDQHFQISPFTRCNISPSEFPPPQSYLNEETAYNQMGTYLQSSYPNFGNIQEFPQLNNFQYSADPFEGYDYNINHITLADGNLGMITNNMDVQMEKFKKELANALGSDANLHEDMKFLAKYNNVVHQENLHQEPIKEFSTPSEVSAPAEFAFSTGEQMTYSYGNLAEISNDTNAGSVDLTGSSSETLYPQPLPSHADEDDDFNIQLNSEDFANFFDIFPDIHDEAHKLGLFYDLDKNQ